jgi:hypothetical protein
MNVYIRAAFDCKKHYSEILDFIASDEDGDYYDDGNCADGNRWFAFHSDISIRPIKGDCIQVSDCVRFVINKVIIHLDESDNGENFITVECMYDDSYEG